MEESVMRLDKYLSDMGVGTRSEVKKAIRQGAVTVDGVVIKGPGQSVPEISSQRASGRRPEVCFRGVPVIHEETVYYMLHKPAGIISASSDRHEKTVISLITEPTRKDLFPAGRLDRDTEGLLLITNDGALAHRLLSPAHHVDKTYFAVIDGTVTEADVSIFKEGLRLSDDFTCLPADLKILSAPNADVPIDISKNIPAAFSAAIERADEVSYIEITIREGKFHQIRRMFHAVGKEVLYLKRLSMGPLQLDPDLPAGSYRRLTDDEIHELKSL